MTHSSHKMSSTACSGRQSSLTSAYLAPLSRVRLHDHPAKMSFKQRQTDHLAYLLSLEADRLLAPFRDQAGLMAKASSYGGWEERDIRGHSLGHYLSAISLMYASTGDKRLKERGAYILAELDECRRANGDGYVLPVDKSALLRIGKGEIDATGFSLNGVWVPFYTMHKVMAGLRDACRYADSMLALGIEKGLANWLDGILGGLDAAQIQNMLLCEHGGMNEVLADLTADTGDARYARMASQFFHQAAVLDPILHCEDRLDGLHANTQIPKIVGIARESEVGGDLVYRQAARFFWQSVALHRSFANGGHSESEHFFPVDDFPDKLTPFTCETCNTYNMLKLTRHLFEWEPNATYMDFAERATINHLLANIGQAPGEFGYFLGLGSVGVKSFSTYSDSWWCCVGTGLENPARYGELIYAYDIHSLWVNLYMGSTLQWSEKDIVIRQITSFPDEERVRIEIECARPTSFALKLRHPGWCEALEVRVNGQSVQTASTPSSYVTIDRTWQTGDIVEIWLPMDIRLEALPNSDGRIVACLYGPMLLAGIVPDREGQARETGKRYVDHLTARGKTDVQPPYFVADSREQLLSRFMPTNLPAAFRNEGVVRPADLTFVPFHHVYEEQYAVYFQLLDHEEADRREGEIRDAHQARLAVDAATIDRVTPGYQQPEVEHHLRHENSTTGDFLNRKYRESKGGWFSYDMAVSPSQPVSLSVTYWGGEWGDRKFRILVDGHEVAIQTLFANRPGDFFDQAYPIPPELTRGKSTVEIRFEPAEPESNAGRIFDIRILR